MSAGQRALGERLTDLGLRWWSVDASAAVTPALPAEAAASVTSVALAALSADAVTPSPDAGNLVALPWPPEAIVVELTDDRSSRERLVRIVTLFHADLRQKEHDAIAIDGFNRQLSQSYEEVNLVYRMAKLLGSTGEPSAVVQSMCDELRVTLNYGWLAMAFNDGDAVLASLRHAVLHAGTLPCTPEHFAMACRAANDTAIGRVLRPGDHPLAQQSGTEVLAERVMHGTATAGVLIAGDRQGSESDVTSSEIQLIQAAAGFLGLFHENAFRFAEQRRQFLGTLHALSAAVDAKDPYTRGHSERVALLGWQLATAIGYDAAAADAVRVAGLLHDIGKIGVPESVLRKPARLTDEEFALIKRHPEIGYQILKDLPSLSYHLPGVLHHHEQWNGRGYPRGLSGENIPMVARILAFADTFDAMSSNRAYRKGLDRDHVLAEIRKSGGTQLDPHLVESFTSMNFTAFDQMLAAQELPSD